MLITRKLTNFCSRSLRAAVVLVIVCTGVSSCSSEPVVATCGLSADELGIFVSVPSGSFIKSKNPVYAEEGSPQQLEVSGFEILAHEVTNAQFAEFVSATSYLTDAERSMGQERADSGSAVFSATGDESGKWSLVNGASWKQPEGGHSDLQGKETHPVVHVSYNDAVAYAEWAGGRLPTDIEWEYASILGTRDANEIYGDAFDDQGDPIANTWQGVFPVYNTAADEFKGAAPVGCFTASQIGLFDMIGNVWEWTSTQHNETFNVIKGGSFLCAPNYCRRYRSAAKQNHEIDFSTNHIGFRIVRTVKKVE